MTLQLFLLWWLAPWTVFGLKRCPHLIDSTVSFPLYPVHYYGHLIVCPPYSPIVAVLALCSNNNAVQKWNPLTTYYYYALLSLVWIFGLEYALSHQWALGISASVMNYGYYSNSCSIVAFTNNVWGQWWVPCSLCIAQWRLAAADLV